MPDEITIPILPCRSIGEILEFYVAMGFEITYQQSRPNTYACVKRDDINLHFFTLRDYDPAQSYSTCIVLTPDVDALHQAFAAGLRQHYGKLPVAGIPRITRPNNKNSAGDRRFNVVDPGGNWIRISQIGKTAESQEKPASHNEVSTKLSRAFVAADLLANSKGDFAAAAKMLDAAFAHDEPVHAALRLQALVLRVELAVNLDDPPLARKLLAEARQIPLQDDERAALTDELQRMDDLAQQIAP